MPKILPVLFLLLLSLGLKAQTWEVGAAVGGAGYMGDLNLNNPIKVSGISFGGFVQRNFDGYWAVKLNYTYGRISAADSNSTSQQFRDRNLSFTTTLSEVAALGEFNFFKYIPEAGKNKFTPYIYAGFAAANYRPQTTYNGSVYDLRLYGTEGEKKPYSNLALSIPYGVGVKYNIVGKWTISANIGYRNTNTDYLDDVSGVYATPSSNVPVAKALADRSGEKTGVYIGTIGTQRGDGNPHDTYFFTQIGISYTFVTQKCYFQ
jgi:hypothetical protein